MQNESIHNEKITTASECAAFFGQRCLARGRPAEVIERVLDAVPDTELASVLVFDCANSEVMELDLRLSKDELRARWQTDSDTAGQTVVERPRKRGRPKLGVVSKEVTLLPRHWEWLAAQPGGASVALRKLVETARKKGEQGDWIRARQESCYRFMSAMAGDLPHFEEAVRALYAREGALYRHEISSWPEDVRQHCEYLSNGVFAGGSD